MTHNQATNRKQGAILKGMGMVAGVSDLVWLHKGTLYCLELKTDIGRLSQAQKQWAEVIKEHEADYIVIRSLKEFQDLVKTVIENSFEYEF